MRYLVSVKPEITGEQFKDDWAPDGEPVIPCYPGTHGNCFLSIKSFKPTALAKVAIIDDDPDKLVDKLVEEYPGLPRQIHENYILSLARVAQDSKIGSMHRIYVDADTATIQGVEDEKLKILWESQPLGVL
jgi:hypothetical protein